MQNAKWKMEKISLHLHLLYSHDTRRTKNQRPREEAAKIVFITMCRFMSTRTRTIMGTTTMSIAKGTRREVGREMGNALREILDNKSNL